MRNRNRALSTYALLSLMSIQFAKYGTTEIQCELTYVRRKTLGINVRPDLQVTVKVPESTPQEEAGRRLCRPSKAMGSK
jgi:hypothetical protein